MADFKPAHGSELGDADRFFFEEVRADACADAEVVSLARANDLQKFALGVPNPDRRGVVPFKAVFLNRAPSTRQSP